MAVLDLPSWRCTITQSSTGVTDHEPFGPGQSNVYRVQEAGGMLVVQWIGQRKSYTVVSWNTAHVLLSSHPLFPTNKVLFSHNNEFTVAGSLGHFTELYTLSNYTSVCMDTINYH